MTNPPPDHGEAEFHGSKREIDGSVSNLSNLKSIVARAVCDMMHAVLFGTKTLDIMLFNSGMKKRQFCLTGVAIPPAGRFIAKQDSLVKIENNDEISFWAIRRIYALNEVVLMNFPNQSPEKIHLTAVNQSPSSIMPA
ncbi:hypothetical protein TNCV_406591 [Trichonephila clavipes]|nr:hypothetical protein TNCV_406591 [Trichonephila clavipes]